MIVLTMRAFHIALGCFVMTSSVHSLSSFSKRKSSYQSLLRTSRNLQTDFEKSPSFMSLLHKAKFVRGRELDDTDTYVDFGFDITQYSIKYAGCSDVQTYSDAVAATEGTDTVLQDEKFVFFRLCPVNSCNKYTKIGCTKDYGEYLIEMEDYIEAASDYYEQRNERYCNYCQPCYQNNTQQYEDAVNDESEESDSVNDDINRRLEDASYEEEACDKITCADSYDICYRDEGDINVHDFLKCVAVEGDDNTEYFLSPYCSSDKFTITVGVFSDEICSSIISGKTALDVTGFDIDTVMMATYFPKECNTCLESANEFENAFSDTFDENEVSELCSNLYTASAKCNKGLKSYYYPSEDSGQAQQEDNVCTFINSIFSGNYNESGKIDLNVNWYFNVSNWRSSSEYMNQFSNVKKYATDKLETWQIFLLVILPLACIVLWLRACCLQCAIRRRGNSWKPRGSRDIGAFDMSRQNSGIMLRRSRSGGTGNVPLI